MRRTAQARACRTRKRVQSCLYSRHSYIDCFHQVTLLLLTCIIHHLPSPSDLPSSVVISEQTPRWTPKTRTGYVAVIEHFLSSLTTPQAAEYLLDPLNAPDPSQETGPGSSFRSDSVVSPVRAPPSPTANRLSKNNPYRKSSISKDGKNGPTTTTTEVPRRSNTVGSRTSGSYPSPPASASASPRSPNFSGSHREALSDSPVGRRRRGSSLTERYPGDMSHRPLDQLAREKAIADKSRHVTKKHHIHPDTIDNLAGPGAYHHSGPYDATLLARNNTRDSPLAALKDSNEETLKATPRENILDSVRGHRPLDGVAAYPSGSVDRLTGHKYEYEAGENMMIDNNPEGGAYKRMPGVQYHPDDIKGKGEPSYSIEKALKEHRISDDGHRRDMAEGIEMTSQHRRSGSGRISIDEDGSGVRRSGSFGKRLSGSGLKKRIGSLRSRMHSDHE